MFRKISENAESDSDGKKTKNLLEKISRKPYFWDNIKKWR